MKEIYIPLVEYIELLECKVSFLSELETNKTPEITKEIALIEYLIEQYKKEL